MKYQGLNECWTCEKLKRGECKHPVSTNKQDHGGCSDWKNDELYSAWYEENGETFEQMMKVADDYIKEREKECQR